MEGVTPASIDVRIATCSELEDLMVFINQDVFGMSIGERRKAYRDRTLSTDTALDTPICHYSRVCLAHNPSMPPERTPVQVY